MSKLAEIPREIRTHHNPALIALILRKAVDGYASETDGGLPIPLIPFVSSGVLTSRCREALPASKATRIVTWASEHPSIANLWIDRTASLMRTTQKATILGIAAGYLIYEGKAIAPGSLSFPNKISNGHQEIKEMFGKAALIGRWFANTGSVSTVLLSLGLRAE